MTFIYTITTANGYNKTECYTTNDQKDIERCFKIFNEDKETDLIKIIDEKKTVDEFVSNYENKYNVKFTIDNLTNNSIETFDNWEDVVNKYKDTPIIRWAVDYNNWNLKFQIA